MTVAAGSSEWSADTFRLEEQADQVGGVFQALLLRDAGDLAWPGRCVLGRCLNVMLGHGSSRSRKVEPVTRHPTSFAVARYEPHAAPGRIHPATPEGLSVATCTNSLPARVLFRLQL